jgi:hypothetical protein
MLGFDTHGTSFSYETMAKPMSHGLRAFVPSVNSCWPLLVVFSCFTNLGRFFFDFFLRPHKISISIFYKWVPIRVSKEFG